MRHFLFLLIFLSAFSSCVAADDPKKPTPPTPPPPPYPALPENYSLSPDMNRLLEPTRAFLDATKTVFDALEKGGSGELTINREFGAPITKEFFQSITTVQPILRSLIDQTAAQAAAAKIDLAAARALKQGGGPRFSEPRSLLPLIAEVKDKNSILRYLAEMHVATMLAESRARTALQILGSAGLLTEANVQAAYLKGLITPAQIIQWRESMRLNAPIPMVDGRFSQAATRLTNPQVLIPPRPDAINPFLGNPFNSLGGGGPFNGTRFYTGMPGYVPPIQMSPGANFTPVHVRPPLVVIPRVGP